MAAASSWANFFTGAYNSIVDGHPADPAQLVFAPTGDPNMLSVRIKSPYWNDVGDAHLSLKTGYIKGTIAGPGYGNRSFHLGCWELVASAAGGLVVGFDPSGAAIHVRFDGGTEGHIGTHTLQFNSATAKARPDHNYPWNLP
jgi:hypothetical protein